MRAANLSYCPKDGDDDGREYVMPSEDKDLIVQLVLSLLIGVSAFVAFCIMRPRWPELYAARKRRLEPHILLPEMPNTFLGWIPKLYKVSEEQVLATAGLDAFVFLNFFKMAIRLFAIMAFFATAVMWPINSQFRDFTFPFGNHSSDTTHLFYRSEEMSLESDIAFQILTKGDGVKADNGDHPFWWSYVIFTYFFVGLTIYFINWETFRVVKLRQKYLGTQSTITDRTFRLTGIPSDLRDENEIKDLIENLDIGRVDCVTICRDWKEIDDLMDARNTCLRSLESSWAKYLKIQQTASKGNHNLLRRGADSPGSSPDEEDGEAGENGRLLENNLDQPDDGSRPQVTLRYGPFGMRTRQVDAIDYYEEKLRRLDGRIVQVRKKDFKPTDMALVTMDSVAACQMVIQARIDPRPGRLLTKATPSPSDLVWRNTYALRGIRRLKSWTITIFITFLTLVWIFPTASLASLMSMCTISRLLPAFALWLDDHDIIHSLLQTGVPTLVVSLLNVAVPYLYDWLSNCQGMISQSDIELSLISKNFFFTFFNTFFIFTLVTTALDFWSIIAELQDFLKDTSKIAITLAQFIEKMSPFYTSFIMLQGIGLMPFRILEMGSVFLHPIFRFMSATPRDYAALKKPPMFQYGFFLPTALLVFNLCLIYSVVQFGFIILIVGTIYFSLGYMTFKYMVLYAMDQPQHATGGAWRMICYRVMVGLLVFETVMFGQVASHSAYIKSLFIVPLFPFTIWYSYYYKRRFEPLTRYIALRAIQSAEEISEEDETAVIDDEEGDEEATIPRPSRSVLRRGSTLDEVKERDLAFINPSLVTPLERPWIYEDPPPPIEEESLETDEDQPSLIVPSTDSSLGIGEANVWRQNTDSSF
ncbi:unnamed protein product [Clonostachys rosea f. rosea IK726]|uniref:Calcium permeable stress-gated cation channel 1 n=2 Tax=Bionectria ochroleuca TaxID=29856 RepID=A0A0B7K1D7_BIOOC|nr:unnamed protein product [Clonostachys rosea f. rosea IK726]